MNCFTGNGDAFSVPFAPIRFAGEFEVCWAGPHPFQKGFCFGSLDGRILFTDEEGVPLLPLEEGSDSREAINGVARAEIWVAVTTREEVNFRRLLGTVGSPKSRLAIPYGAHDITTTSSGCFIAPLGRNGIMAVRPPFTLETRLTIYTFTERLYAYHVISLRSQTGAEVLVCACRRGGLAAGELSSDQQRLPMTTATFDGLDVVDICSLDPGANSLAIAALGREGTLILSHDVMQDKKPLSLKFSSVKGVAYRVLSSRGDIYILTSKGIYVLGKLASRFLAGELVHGTITPILPLPMEAVDVNLSANRWLLAVMSNEVRKYDADLIHQSLPEQQGLGQFQEFQETVLSPDWERFDIQETTKQIAAVA
jgi:hypothetical protein